MPSTPTRRSAGQALFAASLSAAIAALPGCGASWFTTDDASADAVKPEDFIGEPRPPGPPPDTPTTLIATDAPGEDETTDNPRSAERRDNALAVNAMVGHINGEAVYANQIFDINIAAQLESFGRRYDDEQFLSQAALVIQERLRGVIINKLILGEAERNLTETQRRGIDARVQAEREELLRFYGQGSVAVAKARFREKQGKGLDEHLDAFREELSIGFYIRSKVMPKIVVNENDIKRWYHDHKAQFDTPDRRVIRMIRVTGTNNADAVKRRLERGEAFEKVAADAQINIYNPDGAGIVNGGSPLVGDKAINPAPVNDALMQLKEDEYAGPVLAGDHQYFVQLVEFQAGVKVPLADAQLKIEEQLRAAQFEKHALRFRLDLLERGSYTDPMEMGEKLLEIAYARYDQ